MTMTNTSRERVDTLIQQSDRIYDVIDPIFDGEPRYRRMLRIGINTLALTLRQSMSADSAGETLLELRPTLKRQKGPLDTLGNLYADVERATVDRQGKPETDARHAIHLMKLSAPYAKEYYPKLRIGKIASYAISHDIIEAFAGDTPSLGMTPEQEAQKNFHEARALVRLRQEYGETYPEFLELIEAYETLEDAEARFVKTFDKLDPAFTHLYNSGAEIKTRYGLSEESFIQAIDESTARMRPYSSEFSQLMLDRSELIQRVVRVTYQKVA